MFDLTPALDLAGIAVFAVTGALVASRKQMDIFGFILLGTVTGVGGGTLRDLLLGVAVFWVHDPKPVLVCAVASVITFFLAHIPESRYRLLLWLDALGLGAVAVRGSEKAMAAGVEDIVAIMMAVITATFGGIIRDILGGESPILLRKEIYVTAALLGAITHVLILNVGIPNAVAGLFAFTVAFGIRALALRFNWQLPVYKPRRARTPEELGL